MVRKELECSTRSNRKDSEIMGLLDYTFITFVGGTFVITLITLLFSIAGTKDEDIRNKKKKKYLPTILGSAAILILYFGFLSIVNVGVTMINH